jgi:hypothetical protein
VYELIEVVLVSVTGVTLGSLWFADRVHKREYEPEAAVSGRTEAETREVLRLRDSLLTDAKNMDAHANRYGEENNSYRLMREEYVRKKKYYDKCIAGRKP